MEGQTLAEIRDLLEARGLHPQHRFGQNFLIDLNLMRKLVSAAGVGEGDLVLEVGAGTGSLTELLLAAGATVIAVEIDRGLQALLRERFAEQPRFSLIAGDALAGKHRLNPDLLEAIRDRRSRGQPVGRSAAAAFKLVANLPYQIATPLLADLLLLESRFTVMACTLQREVGERLTAAPRSSAYGPISVLVQTLARAEHIADLPPQAFWPRPKVDSVMLRITPVDTPRVRNVPRFSKLVHEAFAQRRKMLRRMMREWKSLDVQSAFGRAGINPDARPEELSPSDWQALADALGPAPADRSADVPRGRP